MKLLICPAGSRLANSGISGRPLSRYAGDKTCFELARKWRNTCIEEHGKSCGKAAQEKMSSRVVDVGPVGGSQEPRLRITGHEKGEWVALSHCWGSQCQFVTNSNNLNARQRILPLKDMPKTFSDAIIVTRQLGYRYLWIDSICILQGDHEVWITESSRMRDYYKHAVVTISADFAPGDQVGFLTKRADRYPEAVMELESGEKLGIRIGITCPTFRDEDTCISRRAWTLQEFVLSPRSLLYTLQQLVWECQTQKYGESDENMLGGNDLNLYRATKRLFSTPALGKEQFPDFQEFFDPVYRWYILMNDYCTRELTDMNDLFPAISGLTREIQQQSGYSYLAGIWVEDIHRGLLWKLTGAGQPLTKGYAPSWSWASLGTLPGALDPSHDLYWSVRLWGNSDISNRRAALINYHVNLKDEDPFGCISFGLIRIRGNSLPAKQWRGKAKTHFNFFEKKDVSRYYPQRVLGPDQLVCYLDIAGGEVSPKKILEAVTIFQISIWNWNDAIISLALLLLPVKDKPVDTYTRVGIAEVPNVDGLAEDGWVTKDVCII